MIAGSSFLRKQLEPRAPHGVTSGVETLDVSGTPDPNPLLLAHRSATDFGAQISHRTGRWRPRPPLLSGRGRGRMVSIMDRRLRRAPDAEWVLMYRLGLSRKCIAELVRVHPAVIGYHLVIARRLDPELESEHHAAAGARTSHTSLTRMEEVTAWILAEGRLPRARGLPAGRPRLATPPRL